MVPLPCAPLLAWKHSPSPPLSPPGDSKIGLLKFIASFIPLIVMQQHISRHSLKVKETAKMRSCRLFKVRQRSRYNFLQITSQKNGLLVSSLGKHMLSICFHFQFTFAINWRSNYQQFGCSFHAFTPFPYFPYCYNAKSTNVVACINTYRAHLVIRSHSSLKIIFWNRWQIFILLIAIQAQISCHSLKANEAAKLWSFRILKVLQRI